jgi:PEP-CTERM motif
MKKILLLFCMVIMIFGAAGVAQADLTLGTPADPGGGNCFPFGCGYTGDYQQVYNSSQFSGPITITKLEFFNTQSSNTVTAMNTGNWAISLSTTAADSNTLSPNYSSNKGANNTLVFNGNLAQSWAFGDTLVIALTTPFTYDPSSGNLLLDVVSTASAPGGSIFFDVGSYSYMGRVYYNGGGLVSGFTNPGYGLVTEFGTDTTSNAVPEPATMLLLGLGLAGVAVARKKFQK